MTTQAAFDQWYHDVPGVNVTKVLHLSLGYDATNGWYKFTTPAGGFFPWDGDANSWVGQGKENLSSGHDFGFTSEVRYWFQYDATHTPTLSFDGDDDVWVFIRRKLAVDIGGLHPPQNGTVTLDATTASGLGLQDGHVYEIVLLHAERHTSGSNFNLTLNGFTSRKSSCTTTCGDGIVAGDEECDNGKNDGSYGTCTASCKRAPFCGDAIRQAAFEACDDGVNLTTYSGASSPGCAPGCKKSAYCGDKHIDALFGEQCDDGTNSGGYGKCAAGCVLGPRCGDGVVQAKQGEQCDDGNLVNGDGCAKDCTSEQPG
jgi:fibro-slime domain-containing protein